MSYEGRRRFLRTLGVASAAGAAVPLLRWSKMRTAKAQDDFPKRLVVVFTPNGIIPDEWFPSGTETEFNLRSMSAPLSDRVSDMLLFRGVHMTSAEKGPGLSHDKGMGHSLTATSLLSESEGGLAGGISIDQLIADQIGQNSPFRSLELGVRSWSHVASVGNRMCYRGAGRELPPDMDPRSVFERLFGDPNVNAADAAKRRLLKKSVLDYASGELDVMEKKLGVADRAKLDGHREGILALEKRLGLVGDVCTAPSYPREMQVMQMANMPAIGDAQMDLAVAALKCDMTRVVSLQWNKAIGDQEMSWVSYQNPLLGTLPVNGDHHGLSHAASPTNIFERPQLIQVQRWYARKFVELLTKLDVEEGSGSLLDNTAVLWVNELGDGMFHKHTDIPFVLAGGKNLGIRGGRFLQYADKPHNDLYVSLANLFGLSIDSFGDPEVCTGALAGLT